LNRDLYHDQVLGTSVIPSENFRCNF